MTMFLGRKLRKATMDKGWLEVFEWEEPSAVECAATMVEGLMPLLVGTPTGLCDCQGVQLLEGDTFRLDCSEERWQVRFAKEHGFIGYCKKPCMEIWFILASSVRVGRVLHRRWLKEITKEG